MFILQSEMSLIFVNEATPSDILQKNTWIMEVSTTSRHSPNYVKIHFAKSTCSTLTNQPHQVQKGRFIIVPCIKQICEPNIDFFTTFYLLD